MAVSKPLRPSGDLQVIYQAADCRRNIVYNSFKTLASALECLKGQLDNKEFGKTFTAPPVKADTGHYHWFLPKEEKRKRPRRKANGKRFALNDDDKQVLRTFGNREEDLDQIMENLNKSITTLRHDLVKATIKELLNLLEPFENGIELKLCYRYVDDDCEQDIIRFKKIRVENASVICTVDHFNGEHFASETFFDDDDCFHNEETVVYSLSESKPYMDVLDELSFLYDDLMNFTLPRLAEKRNGNKTKEVSSPDTARQPMTREIFHEKWGDTDPHDLDEEKLKENKDDCFELYEQAGFLDTFDSPYDDEGEHNGMPFKVLRRATTEECDLEAMPLWLVQFDNGDTAYCYPEEIARLEHQ